MAENSIEMGWAARPVKEQHPVLNEETADQFDRDNQEMHRLRLRGLISDGEMRSVRRRYVKSVASAIRKAIAEV